MPMPKDDYYAIAYKILTYLYETLKKGLDIDPLQISHTGGKLININKKYWLYIMENLLKDGYIENIEIIKLDYPDPVIVGLDTCRITPKGIEYLNENTVFKKARETFKDISDIINAISRI